MHLFLEIFLVSHIIGGDKAFAQNLKDERFLYEVQIENNKSKVITKMHIRAVSEEDAYNNVSLNGWTVIGARRVSDDERKTIELSADSVSTKIPNKIVLENAIGDLPLAEKENIQPPTKPINVRDNINLLPTSNELILKLIVFNDFGEIKSNNYKEKLQNLPKNRDYVLFGNADEVRVGKNAVYVSNYDLSYKRAEYIKNYLIKNGHSADRLTVIGLGVKYPLEKTNKSSKKNRRVEIYGFRTQE